MNYFETSRLKKERTIVSKPENRLLSLALLHTLLTN